MYWNSLRSKKSSYENFKEIDLTPQIFPNGLGRYDTVAYADFNLDGFIDIFGAHLLIGRQLHKRQQPTVNLIFT